MAISSTQFLARIEYPRGLLQPYGCYRFGSDTLLLATFTAAQSLSKRLKRHRNHIQAVELGCGAGAAILGVNLLNPTWGCSGFDFVPQMIAAAEKNAEKLGLPTKFLVADIEAPLNKTAASRLRGQVQVVIANPPWRKDGTGRQAQDEMREKALGHAPEDYFCATAADLLCWHGLYCCIIPPRSICEFITALQKNRFGVRQILPVSSHAGESARRLLCASSKYAAHDPVILPPLILHNHNGGWTSEALAFCPWLANAPHPGLFKP